MAYVERVESSGSFQIDNRRVSMGTRVSLSIVDVNTCWRFDLLESRFGIFLEPGSQPIVSLLRALVTTTIVVVFAFPSVTIFSPPSSHRPATGGVHTVLLMLGVGGHFGGNWRVTLVRRTECRIDKGSGSRVR